MVALQSAFLLVLLDCQGKAASGLQGTCLPCSNLGHRAFCEMQRYTYNCFLQSLEVGCSYESQSTQAAGCPWTQQAAMD